MSPFVDLSTVRYKSKTADSLQTVLQGSLAGQCQVGQTSEVKGKNFTLYYQKTKSSRKYLVQTSTSVKFCFQLFV